MKRASDQANGKPRKYAEQRCKAYTLEEDLLAGILCILVGCFERLTGEDRPPKAGVVGLTGTTGIASEVSLPIGPGLDHPARNFRLSQLEGLNRQRPSDRVCGPEKDSTVGAHDEGL